MQPPRVSRSSGLWRYLCFVCLLLAISVDVTHTQQVYELEMYLVLDHYAFDLIYMKENNQDKSKAEASAKGDIDYFITQTNKMYESLSPIKMKLRIKEVKIYMDGATPIYPHCNLNIKPGNKREHFDSGEGLECFIKWLDDEKLKDSVKFDLALLWTGIGLSGRIAGLARLGGVCAQSGAASIVEYSGSYIDVVTTAHEIGHNLAMTHDPGNIGWIMAPGVAIDSTKRWSFSPQSLAEAKAKIDKLGGGGCMATRDGDSTVPDVGPTQAMADPNTICTRTEGENSYMSFQNFPDKVAKGDKVCESIPCAISAIGSKGQFPTEGMVCGREKRCNRRKCEVDPAHRGESRDENCLFGDQKKWTGRSTEPVKSCYDHIEEKGAPEICAPRMNQDDSTKYCCGSCASLKDKDSKSASCPWGEFKIKGTGDVMQTCQEAFESFGKDSVCGTQNYRLSCNCSCEVYPQVPDLCLGMTCNNQGTCSDGKCTCNAGYSGHYCLDPLGGGPPDGGGGGDGDDEDDDGGLSGGIIAVIVIAALSALCVLAGVALFVLRKQWEKNKEVEAGLESGDTFHSAKEGEEATRGSSKSSLTESDVDSATVERTSRPSIDAGKETPVMDPLGVQESTVDVASRRGVGGKGAKAESSKKTAAAVEMNTVSAKDVPTVPQQQQQHQQDKAGSDAGSSNASEGSAAAESRKKRRKSSATYEAYQALKSTGRTTGQHHQEPQHQPQQHQKPPVKSTSEMSNQPTRPTRQQKPMESESQMSPTRPSRQQPMKSESLMSNQPKKPSRQQKPMKSESQMSNQPTRPSRPQKPIKSESQMSNQPTRPLRQQPMKSESQISNYQKPHKEQRPAARRQMDMKSPSRTEHHRY